MTSFKFLLLPPIDDKEIVAMYNLDQVREMVPATIVDTLNNLTAEVNSLRDAFKDKKIQLDTTVKQLLVADTAKEDLAQQIRILKCDAQREKERVERLQTEMTEQQLIHLTILTAIRKLTKIRQEDIEA